MIPSEESNRPVVLIGGGGHARVLIEALLMNGAQILGFTDPRPRAAELAGIPYLGDDRILSRYTPGNITLVNGVGSGRCDRRRRTIYEQYSAEGYAFEPVIHPSAIVATDVRIASGAQVMAGAVLQPGVRIGPNAIINTCASADHDCHIGPHVHIAPGVTLCGGIHAGEGAFVGAGAVVIPGVHLGEWCTVGSGGVVIRDVPAGATVVGTPAREVRRRRQTA